MSTASTPSWQRQLPLLANGDQLTQQEFHRRYLAYPDDVTIELINGTVYMASPLRWPHGTYSTVLAFLLELYRLATPGVEAAENATAILGPSSEPQPDLAMRLLPEYGGQARLNADEYLEGAPEFVAEIAYSTRSIDLYHKSDDYKKAGVIEYLVLCLAERELYWFAFRTGKRLKADRQGIIRSRVFPGFWIHEKALMARDTRRLSAVLRAGIASKEHAAFVRRLERTYEKGLQK